MVEIVQIGCLVLKTHLRIIIAHPLCRPSFLNSVRTHGLDQKWTDFLCGGPDLTTRTHTLSEVHSRILRTNAQDHCAMEGYRAVSIFIMDLVCLAQVRQGWQPAAAEEGQRQETAGLRVDVEIRRSCTREHLQPTVCDGLLSWRLIHSLCSICSCVFAWCVRLSRLLVGFRTHLISMHFHSFHSFGACILSVSIYPVCS